MKISNVMNKILIVVPNSNSTGGVSNFYSNLKEILPSDIVYFYLGNGSGKNLNSFRKSLRLINFVIDFVSLLKNGNYSKVVLNPSLSLNSVFRDSLFVLIANLFRKEVIVFWRGWNYSNEKYLKFPYNMISRNLIYASKSIVLSSKIEESLRCYGSKGDIYQFTTVVNIDCFDFFNLDKKNNVDIKSDFNILFLSRIEKYKGIYELIDAFEILNKSRPNINLIIAGDGSELEKTKEIVINRKIGNVFFPGYVRGNEKYKLIQKSDVFILPSYSEGMPNAVLESMALGIPVCVTKVGGVSDFFVEKKMGRLLEIGSVESIVNAINWIIELEDLSEIQIFNHNYAKSHFSSDIVLKRFLEIIY